MGCPIHNKIPHNYCVVNWKAISLQKETKNMETLQLNPRLLHEAFFYAKQRKINLQKMLEDYIKLFVQESVARKADPAEVTPLVESIGFDLHLPADFDEKEAYRKHLMDKHA